MGIRELTATVLACLTATGSVYAAPIEIVRQVETSSVSRSDLERMVKSYHASAVIWRSNAETEREYHRATKDKLGRCEDTIRDQRRMVETVAATASRPAISTDALVLGALGVVVLSGLTATLGAWIGSH